jgi:archaeal type IV pilus assembly protein PilA
MKRGTTNIQRNDRAVSPVIGVMLMLVVVIIIAAIVSGFAGGLINSNSKTPQATIQASYSVGAGILTMYHAGGDELSTQKIYLVVRGKDEENGGYGGTMTRVVVNKSLICNSAGSTCWQGAAGNALLTVWRPGETMICNDSLAVVWANTGQGSNAKQPTTSDIGKSFTLEIDSTDGRLISKNDVKIGP